MIRLTDVSFSYQEEEGQEKALHNVSLDFNEGEFIGIAGHNGSGKSTLAKLLNGLLVPTEGDVTVLGMNTKTETSLQAIRKNVGMVFQNPDNQMVATIVEEDVAFGAENLGLDPTEIRRNVDEALESVGMLEFKDKRPSQLSGGQKQRVAIAGVLAMKPKCIVFDESTSMLDPNGRSELLSTIHKLNKQDGVTVILITHYMEELVGADRIIAMNNGAVAFSLPPKEAFSDNKSLSALRLSVPEAVEIAEGLRELGIGLPDGLLTAQELVEALCQLK